MNIKKLGIWFPTVKTNTGTDVFTERLVEGLNKKGVRAEITWLPLRAEYAPWTVAIPQPPEWATIAHINTWLHSRFLPKKLPIIATLHHSIHDPNLRPHKGILRALYHQYWIAPNERRVMQQAKQVTAVSQFVANMAKQTLCDVPMEVIYNGIDSELFYPNNKNKKIGKPFRLLYIGSWMKRKGVDLLPIIMRELDESFELYYTGGETAEKDKVSIPKNMYDLGRLNQQQVIYEMHKADAFLFPSRSEGFGLVVVEAMACGLPVIVSDLPVLAEIIDQYSSGILCETNNAHSFITAIKLLASDNHLHKRLSIESNQKAKQAFSEKKLIMEYKNLYNNL